LESFFYGFLETDIFLLFFSKEILAGALFEQGFCPCRVAIVRRTSFFFLFFAPDIPSAQVGVKL